MTQHPLNPLFALAAMMAASVWAQPPKADPPPGLPDTAVSEPAQHRDTAASPGESGAIPAPTATPRAAVAADAEDAEELQKVEIVGRRQISYKNDIVYSATKTAARLKDVPQSVSYVTKELIQDQGAVRTSDVVRNISNVNMFSSYEGDLSLRGFRVGSSTLLNGLPNTAGGWNQSLLWNLERYEVVKGPASMIYGQTDPGGTINMVTKKPLATPRQAVTFTAGSFNSFLTTMDFTGPLNDDKSLLYRLNVGFEDASTFRDLQENRNLMIAPSISFLPDDRTRVNLDFVYASIKGKLDRGQPIFGASAGTDLTSTPISFAIAKPNDYLDETTLNLTASIHHRLTDRISINGTYLKSKFNEDQMEHRTSNSYGVDSAGDEIPTLMGMRTIRREREYNTDNLTAYVVADLDAGPTVHQVLVGFDYGQFVTPKGASSSSSATGYRNAANDGVINNYDPANKDDYLLDADGNPVPNVPHFDLENPDYSLAHIEDYIINSRNFSDPSKRYNHGVYLQDQIGWGPFKALLGLRYEHYVDVTDYEQSTEERVEQSAWIPRVGLVYEILPQVNVYGTYAEGFSPQSASIVQDPDRYGGPFDPLTSRLYEAGVKTELFARRLFGTMSVYQITQNNILVDANDAGNPDLLRQRGQERGRGVEIEVQGQITPAFSLSANTSFSKTEITEDSDPTLVGKEKENAPNTQGGLWARYNLLEGALRGVGAGAGVSFVGERSTFNDDLQLPAYQVYDAALFYNVNRFQLAFRVSNLLDETHWTGGYDYNRLYPGAPRHYVATAAYTF